MASKVDVSALAQLDDNQRKEMTHWVEQEVSKAKVRSSVHTFTDFCFPKCVTSISSPGLSAGETSCLQNCLGRFLDTNVSVVKMIQEQSA